jgi:transposase
MALTEKRYFGFDLGGQGHEVCVCSEDGSVVGRFELERGQAGWRRLQREASRQVPSGGRAVYLIEAAQNLWQEVVHPLSAAGEEVYLLNPIKCSDLRKFYRRHTKTDVIDAQATAQVARADQGLKPVYVGSAAEESLRRLCRLSWKLSQELGDHKRRMSTLLEMVLPGIGKVWKNRYCGSARLFYGRYLDPRRARRLGRKRLAEILRRRAWGKFNESMEERLWSVIENAPALSYNYEDLQLEMCCELDGLAALERRQRELQERICELYGEVDPRHLLESVPGLGPFFAAAITASIGRIDRWQNANQLVAYSGLVPRKKASSGKDKLGQPLTKKGCPQLRSWLYVAAEIIRHHDPQMQAFFRRLRKRGTHHKAAICALAAKLLRRIYAVLKSGQAYQVVQTAELAEEKPVRESVHEVARLLKDRTDTASPVAV